MWGKNYKQMSELTAEHLKSLREWLNETYVPLKKPAIGILPTILSGSCNFKDTEVSEADAGAQEKHLLNPENADRLSALEMYVRDAYSPMNNLLRRPFWIRGQYDPLNHELLLNIDDRYAMGQMKKHEKWMDRYATEQKKKNEKWMDQLQQLILSAPPLSQSMVLYRGIGISYPPEFQTLLKGNIIRSTGFQSLTTQFSVANWKFGCVIKVLVPKGSQILQTMNDAESEWIAPHGSAYRYIGRLKCPHSPNPRCGPYTYVFELLTPKQEWQSVYNLEIQNIPSKNHTHLQPRSTPSKPSKLKHKRRATK